MKYLFYLTFILSSYGLIGQSFDSKLSKRKMKKDLEVFKNIRLKANSGLYKYRTKAQIDSIYLKAEEQINTLSTVGDFYNLICALTDFEGSLHNNTSIPQKVYKTLTIEPSGYFPFPIKQIDGKVRLNFKTPLIPLGSEITSINGYPIKDILHKLGKYYTTDGINTTGKMVGIHKHFSRYFRLCFGLQDEFNIDYISPITGHKQTKVLKSVGYKTYYHRFYNRHSLPFDEWEYKSVKENDIYTYSALNEHTGLLTIKSFSIGDNEKDPKHKAYMAFLDRVFSRIKTNNIQNLIVDIRLNGGGSDPNDLETYAYLTQRTFQENKEAWVSFNKIPYIKHYDSNIPKFLRPLGVGKYNKMIQNAFPEEKEGKFYQNDTSKDHTIRHPKPNAFTGQVYLLIGPSVASAGSLFGAMVAGNKNTITIGEETMGGYYGHNGHTRFTYVLPKSKIKTSFSIVNLEQDVPQKNNQYYNRGIIPDYSVAQSYSDFLKHRDTQMEFVLELIKKNRSITSRKSNK